MHCNSLLDVLDNYVNKSQYSPVDFLSCVKKVMGLQTTRIFAFIVVILWGNYCALNAQDLSMEIDRLTKNIESDMIQWRRHFHEYPELSNREFKTSDYVAEHLKSLGLEVERNIVKTGLVGVLDTGKPGKTIGLRADMDALPVKERVDLPFASKEKGEYNGQVVDVMHACGHDAHMAILMATASVLVKLKSQLTGKIVFVFQPAEEGAPLGEKGGAELMIAEGLMEKYGIEVIYGLHISSITDVNTILYKPMGIMAAVDMLKIKVIGKQVHGASPWGGVDPIVTSAQIIMGLQTIVSRNVNITKEPAVVTIGKITSGNRNNIIPEEAEMIGTIRTLDKEMRENVHRRIREIVEGIAASAGAKAEVDIITGYPVTYNDPALTAKMLPSLEKAAGASHVRVMPAMTGAEDFSFYAQKVPGLFFFLGGKPLEIETLDASQHHTPDFYLDERGFLLGVRSFIQLVIDTK